MIKAVLFDLGDTLIVEGSIGNKHLWEVLPQKVPYVDDVLRGLKEKYKLGIVTNTTASREHHVRACLRKLGVERYFDVIVTSVDMGCEKPNGRIFLEALETLNVRPDDAVMVGDRVSKDILGANKLGMKTILFKWNDRYSEKITSPYEQPTHTINSLKELPRVLSEF